VYGETNVRDEGLQIGFMLANAFDAVIRDEGPVQRLWTALGDQPVECRWEVMPPLGFRDPGKVQMFG
jgi:5-methylcytosine-specific restriction enzyme A